MPYALSLFLRVPNGSALKEATVALLPADSPTNKSNRSGNGSGVSAGLSASLAVARFSGLTAEWQRFTAELVSPTTDLRARLAVRHGPAVISVAGCHGHMLYMTRTNMLVGHAHGCSEHGSWAATHDGFQSHRPPG